MIKVYFESKTHSELVAVFDSEELYDICRDALLKKAKENWMTITESNDNKEMRNDVMTAKYSLEEDGYFVDNLWHVKDVMDKHDVTEEEAQLILNTALTDSYTMEHIWTLINFNVELKG